MNYYWILDAGHGGVDKNGLYTTAPRKMFKFEDGLTILEGVVNRQIAKLLYQKLSQARIAFGLVYDEVEDTPLGRRVQIADAIFAKHPNAIYLSIHSNAGKGSGFEVFTSPGQNKSDRIANFFCEAYMKHFPHHPFRAEKSDGDFDKEADFYVLRKTDCPSVLVENLFFDNRKEAEFLLNPEGQEQIASCLFEAIQNCEKLKPI